MIMKTRYFKLVTVCLLAVSLFASCPVSYTHLTLPTIA